jgi:hypothetical protein
MKIDFSSTQWLAIADFLQKEQARLRTMNDAVGLDEPATNALRGEIRLCKKLLALPETANRDYGVGLAE